MTIETGSFGSRKWVIIWAELELLELPLLLRTYRKTDLLLQQHFLNCQQTVVSWMIRQQTNEIESLDELPSSVEQQSQLAHWKAYIMRSLVQLITLERKTLKKKLWQCFGKAKKSSLIPNVSGMPSRQLISWGSYLMMQILTKQIGPMNVQRTLGVQFWVCLTFPFITPILKPNFNLY